MKANKTFKRKYENKLIKRAVDVKENRRFLIEHLKKEWDEIEKSLERDQRKQKQYKVIKETGVMLGVILLGMAAVCGTLVVAAVAPNVFSAFGRFGRYRRYFDNKAFMKRVSYLERRGYIYTVKNNDNRIMKIRLAEFGEAQVAKRRLGDLKIISQDKWDGVWRVVVFDIPEQNKWAREGLRERLKCMGFYPLQKSTFVFPYPCREELVFLERLYDIGGNLRFIETNNLSPDDDLREFFNLQRFS